MAPYRIRLTYKKISNNNNNNHDYKNSKKQGKTKIDKTSVAVTAPPYKQTTTIVPETTTLYDLKTEVIRLFQIEDDYQKLSFLIGYPPKALSHNKLKQQRQNNDDRNDNENNKNRNNDKQIMVVDCIPPNETVIVRLETNKSNTNQQQPGNSSKFSTNNDSSSSILCKISTGNRQGSNKRKKPDLSSKNNRSAGNKTANNMDSGDEYVASNDDDDQEISGSYNGNTTISSSSSRPPRRATANAASDNFKNVQKAMEQMERDLNTKKTKTKGKNTNNSSKKKQPNKLSQSNAKGNRLMSQTCGRKLDGTTVTATAAPNKRKRASAGGGIMKMSSEDDVTSQLLSSLNTSGGGKVGGFLRKAMRGAVLKSYEQSRASVRVSAVQSNKVQFQAHSGSTLNCTSVSSSSLLLSSITVVYSKGMEGRGNYTEKIELLDRTTLEAVICAVHESAHSNIADDDDDNDDDDNDDDNNGPREMLRPTNMAQLSPRVFWSLVYWYQNHRKPQEADDSSTSNGNGADSGGFDVRNALRCLLPKLNWNFLEARSKTLSVKAKENLRQDRVAARGGEISAAVTKKEQIQREEEQLKKATSAVEAVENAMNKVYENDKQISRNRMARAALARLSGGSCVNGKNGADQEDEQFNQEIDDWKLITPSDLDLDEIRECVKEGSSSYLQLSSSNNSCPNINENIDSIINALHTKLSIHNWRELANWESESLFKSLSTSLFSKNEDDVSAGNGLNNGIICKEIAEAWIEEAQRRTMEEIMMEIVDMNHKTNKGNESSINERENNNIEAKEVMIDVLREEARAGTPKDLALWSCIPDMLWKEININDKLKETNTNVTTSVRNEDISRWCNRGKLAVETLDWLNWYATPVD